jgi:hypothetical protein
VSPHPARRAHHAIFVTVDAEYSDVLGLLLKSLARSYPGHPPVVACTSGWTDQMRRALSRQSPGLRWLDVQALTFPAGPPIGHDLARDRRVMYARWAALTPVFDAYETVVYLDADTLVLGPFDELFAARQPLAFEDAYPNRREMVFYDPDDLNLRRLLEEDGLAHWDWERAANAGVLALPRSFRTPAQLVEFTRLSRRYGPFLRWGDQSVLNLWLARNAIQSVRDYRFNYQVRLLVERRALEPYRDAKILHFNGQHGEAPFLMALAHALMRAGPPGRRLVPAAMRLARSPVVARLPGYRARRWLRRLLMSRVLNGRAG